MGHSLRRSDKYSRMYDQDRTEEIDRRVLYTSNIRDQRRMDDMPSDMHVRIVNDTRMERHTRLRGCDKNPEQTQLWF